MRHHEIWNTVIPRERHLQCADRPASPQRPLEDKVPPAVGRGSTLHDTKFVAACLPSRLSLRSQPRAPFSWVPGSWADPLSPCARSNPSPPPPPHLHHRNTHQPHPCSNLHHLARQRPVSIGIALSDNTFDDIELRQSRRACTECLPIIYTRAPLHLTDHLSRLRRAPKAPRTSTRFHQH